MTEPRRTARVAARANRIKSDAETKAAKQQQAVDRMAGVLADMFEEFHERPVRLSIDHTSQFILIAPVPAPTERRISPFGLREAV